MDSFLFTLHDYAALVLFNGVEHFYSARNARALAVFRPDVAGRQILRLLDKRKRLP